MLIQMNLNDPNLVKSRLVDKHTQTHHQYQQHKYILLMKTITLIT